MDAALNNVLEGARQYFMGLPKQAQNESAGQPVWPVGMPPPEEGTPAQSGAPASQSRPPSTAAAPPVTPGLPLLRPPSEPLEPEPHIIHKATVMREALEKRREQAEPEEDDEETSITLSPPPHIIRKPTAAVPSPAPALAAPCPSPARPPSSAPEASISDQTQALHVTSQIVPTQISTDVFKTARSQDTIGSTRLSEPYNTGRPPEHYYRPPDPYPASRPPEPYATGRPPDPYVASRPPESYHRYNNYETPSLESGRSLHGPPTAILQSSSRYSPQRSYSRQSSSMPVQGRIREQPPNSSPARVLAVPAPTAPPLPPNDRVPPIHHPISSSSAAINRSIQPYSSTNASREPNPYARVPVQYDRHTAPAPRKYDPQQSYSGYRPSTSFAPGHIVEQQQMHFKYTMADNHNAHYGARGSISTYDRHNHKLYSRTEYNSTSRQFESRNLVDTRIAVDTRVSIEPRSAGVRNIVDSRGITDSRSVIDSRNLLDTRNSKEFSRNTNDCRNTQNLPSSSASNSLYLSNATLPTHQSATLPPKVPAAYPTSMPAKPTYEYLMPNNIQTSPVRPTTKPNVVNQQARMTVSVTAIVNQMNQTKQKRESPLDLSVKTVKNSADSSTAQDDTVDSATADSKTTLQHIRASSTTRQSSVIPGPAPGYVSSHKVDFAPDFHMQYQDGLHNQNLIITQSSHTSTRFNGALQAESSRPNPVESIPCPSRPSVHYDSPRYNNTAPKHEYPRIDLTRPVAEEKHSDVKKRDDRNYLINERKRIAGPVFSNIPEKTIRYENWTSENRIDHGNRIDRSLKEQQDLMSQPVYSYSSHKRFEAYQNEQKKQSAAKSFRSQHTHVDNRYAYSPDTHKIVPEYHSHYDKVTPSGGRHVVQKITNHRDIHHHHYHHHHHLEQTNGIPADKRILSILRNSLETKQVGLVEPPKLAKEIPDLIVIDDADDTVIEITDLSTENHETHVKVKSDVKANRCTSPSLVSLNVQMPRAVDSIANDFDSQHFGNNEKSSETDVASRIRTKAELKGLPPSEDNLLCPDINQSESQDVVRKLVPKSQKEHLFNQIREDNLRMESVIKSDVSSALILHDIKAEPMSIEDIEKDAVLPTKTDESFILTDKMVLTDIPEDDLDWASTCDNFVEQLKSGCHKKKLKKKKMDTELEIKVEPNAENDSKDESIVLKHESSELTVAKEDLAVSENKIEPERRESEIEHIVIKQEPADVDETSNDLLSCFTPFADTKQDITEESSTKHDAKGSIAIEDKKEGINVIAIENKKRKKIKNIEKSRKLRMKTPKGKKQEGDNFINKVKVKKEIVPNSLKKDPESTDDDEPLIKSKLIKDKEKSDQMKYQLLKDLSEKSAYVKLEFCERANRKSLDSLTITTEKEPIPKLTRQLSRSKAKSLSQDTEEIKSKRSSSSDSDSDDISVACRLRLRKNNRVEDGKAIENKTPGKLSPSKKQEVNSDSATPIHKLGIGDGSAFHPGWEEELYRYKRSIRMPSKLIAIPRGRSGGPYPRSSVGLFNRGSTSLPDLDPAPLSPAPSSVPSAATDDLYTRRQEKIALDSDLDSNSSYSATHKLHYDSEASTSTVFSRTIKKKGSSIVDVLIQKYESVKNKHEDVKSKKCKDKFNENCSNKKASKNTNDADPVLKNSMVLKDKPKGGLIETKVKKAEKNSENLDENGSVSKNSFVDKTSGKTIALSGAVSQKSRTNAESKVTKNKATIKEVFGDVTLDSTPISSGLNREKNDDKTEKEESDMKTKCKLRKQQKDNKEKIKRRSNSIREGLRSTISLKRNDAKGRLLRLKKRNNLLKNLAEKKIKDYPYNKSKKLKSPSPDHKLSEIKTKKTDQLVDGQTKKKFKRLFGRRKLSSGFDYIRKKKKIIKNEGQVVKRIRRLAPKPNPESIHDIQKEIKSWFINKSIGETHLHRAARLGYSDCVAYCLEKLEHDPSAKDNAGFTPLHVAAAKGYVFIGRLLLQYGANVSAAAQGGIRPLHEAAENNNVEMIRLLLSYGADPILGTYAGQTPVELAEGPAANLLRLHIADVQGHALEPWHFPVLIQVLEESGCNSLSSPPPATTSPPPDSTIEIQCTEAPLPPFYSLRAAPGQPAEGLWCLMQDLTSMLQIKSKDSLLKQIHCGSGSPKELFREIKTAEFLERAQCHQLLCAGEKVNVRASKVALVRVTDKLRQLLKVETVLVS